MKVKTFLLVIVSMLLLFNFVLAAEPPIVTGGEDYENLREGIDKYSPVDDSGEVNLDGYKPFVSKAEERIGEVNAWLEENAMWLSIVFGMVPAISLHFFANLYVIFFLVVLLVLNSHFNFGLIPGLDKKISPTSSIEYNKIVGIVFLILLMVTKVTVIFGKVISDLILYIWNVVIPAGIWASIISMIILIVMLIFCPSVVTSMFKMLGKLIVQDAEKKAMNDVASDKAALHKIVQEATKD